MLLARVNGEEFGNFLGNVRKIKGLVVRIRAKNGGEVEAEAWSKDGNGIKIKYLVSGEVIEEGDVCVMFSDMEGVEKVLKRRGNKIWVKEGKLKDGRKVVWFDTIQAKVVGERVPKEEGIEIEDSIGVEVGEFKKIMSRVLPVIKSEKGGVLDGVLLEFEKEEVRGVGCSDTKRLVVSVSSKGRGYEGKRVYLPKIKVLEMVLSMLRLIGKKVDDRKLVIDVLKRGVEERFVRIRYGGVSVIVENNVTDYRRVIEQVQDVEEVVIGKEVL